MQPERVQSSHVRRCRCALFIAGMLFVPVMFSAAVRAQLDGNGVQINTDEMGFNIVGDAANEPSFAINTVNPNVIAVGWRQFDTISSSFRLAGYAYSYNGGATWTNGGVLEPPPDQNDPQQTDPVLACDRFGRFFYNSMLYGNANGQLTYRSDNGGKDWLDPVYIYRGRTDKNWYTIDNRVSGEGAGHHYAIWQFSGRFARSTSEGANWESWDNPARVFAFVETDIAGDVHVGWWEGSDGVRYQRSENAKNPTMTPTFVDNQYIPLGTMPWQIPLNPAGGCSQVHCRAAPAGAPDEGVLYLLSSAVRSDDVCDVMFTRSDDGGHTWSDPIRVNDDPPGADYQWMAAMSRAPGGRLDAVWFDTRDDPAHFLSRLYYSCSYDGGETWIPSRAITDQFDSTIGWPVQEKIGDYFECHSDGGGTAVVYPATYNGEQDVYFLRHHPAWLDATTLIAGEDATFTVSDAWPNRNIWLAYSVSGRGRLPIASLNIIMDIRNPRLAGKKRVVDENGDAAWTLAVPAGMSGIDVWFQAVQMDNASGVLARQIR